MARYRREMQGDALVMNEKKDTVDREKTCPLLLRVFYAIGHHNPLSEYSRGNVPSDELQIYTWLDATLKELTSLIVDVNPEMRKKGTYFEFAVVHPDSRQPVYRMRDIGNVCWGVKGADDAKTLQQLRFCIGDHMDIAVTPPYRNPMTKSTYFKPRPK